MSEPFLSELKIVSFNFAPKGWALANGQTLPINQNQALFSLLGTTYGGNGQTTFNLPNLRGRTPISFGNGHTLGEAAGSDAVTVNLQQLPQHFHFVQAAAVDGNTTDGAGNTLAQVPGRIYTDPAALTTLLPTTVTSVGGSQPHENRQPFTVLNFIIALQGIFPSQN